MRLGISQSAWTALRLAAQKIRAFLATPAVALSFLPRRNLRTQFEIGAAPAGLLSFGPRRARHTSRRSHGFFETKLAPQTGGGLCRVYSAPHPEVPPKGEKMNRAKTNTQPTVPAGPIDADGFPECRAFNLVIEEASRHLEPDSYDDDPCLWDEEDCDWDDTS